MRRGRTDDAVLITSAAESGADEFDRRRRKYAIMMSLRAVCVLGAALTYRLSIVLALAFIVGGLVLPWCAVIIANDRPVKRKAAVGDGQRYDLRPERALPSADDARTVDG